MNGPKKENIDQFERLYFEKKMELNRYKEDLKLYNKMYRRFKIVEMVLNEKKDELNLGINKLDITGRIVEELKEKPNKNENLVSSVNKKDDHNYLDEDLNKKDYIKILREKPIPPKRRLPTRK